MIPFHVVAGLTALTAGAVALFSRKGAILHRRSGLVFVYAMLVMAGTGAIMGALDGVGINVVAGSLSIYLVLSAQLAVRRPAVGAHWVDLGTLLAGLALVAGCLMASVIDAASGEGASYLPVYVIFGLVALIASMGDARVLLANGVKGAARLTRHLWRMCFALWIATSSFFLGQSEHIPAPIRVGPVLAAPVLLVLFMLVFWLVRVSFTRWRPRF
jgi:uncharacterized membrane protein